MPVKKPLGTPPPEQETRDQRQADDADNDRHRIGPHCFAGSSRLPRRCLGDGLALMANEVGRIMQARLGDRSGPVGKLRQMILR